MKREKKENEIGDRKEEREKDKWNRQFGEKSNQQIRSNYAVVHSRDKNKRSLHLSRDRLSVG